MKAKSWAFLLCLILVGFMCRAEQSEYTSGDEYERLDESRTDYLQFYRLIGRSGCSDRGRDICTTADGGYAVCCSTYPFGSYATRLEKYFVSGEIDYAFEISGTGADIHFGLGELSNGHILAAGLTSSYGAGSDDALLTHYNGSFVQWNQVIGGSSGDVFYDIAILPGDASIAVGYTYSFGMGLRDAFVVKFLYDGSIDWVTVIGDGGSEQLEAVVSTTDGGYLAVGNTDSAGSGAEDILVLKLDAAGNMVFARTIGKAGRDEAYAVRETADGGYVIAGETESDGAGAYDGLVIKCDASNAIEWAYVVGGANEDGFSDILVHSSGEYIAVGYVYDLTPYDYLDGIISAFASDGTYLRSSVIQDYNNQFLDAVTEAPDGKLLL
nr:hypothetical protein [bacterium]